MMLALIAVVLFCVLLYNFAVYALPAAIGVTVGYWAVTSGAGVIGGIFAGLVAGVITFVVGQAVFSSTRSVLVRSIVAGLFVIPALWAGYSLVLQLATASGTTSGIWQHVLAVIGAAIIGATAFARLTGYDIRLPSDHVN